VISVYKQGDWLDMCLGPHLPSTGKLGKAFKLTKVSGAYWRGDAKNAQLQRVYGTIFFSDKELKEYLHRIEEAEKRDHRRIGREMGLFHQQEDSAGMVYWHPKGWTFWRTLESYLGASSRPAAMSRSRRRSSTTAGCGRRRATGRSSARTCISARTRKACARSSPIRQRLSR
jgi:Threonyl-tRNA synthetase